MLLEMLDGKGFGCDAWLGRHTDGRSARKAYLALARPRGVGEDLKKLVGVAPGCPYSSEDEER